MAENSMIMLRVEGGECWLNAAKLDCLYIEEHMTVAGKTSTFRPLMEDVISGVQQGTDVELRIVGDDEDGEI